MLFEFIPSTFTRPVDIDLVPGSRPAGGQVFPVETLQTPLRNTERLRDVGIGISAAGNHITHPFAGEDTAPAHRMHRNGIVV